MQCGDGVLYQSAHRVVPRHPSAARTYGQALEVEDKATGHSWRHPTSSWCHMYYFSTSVGWTDICCQFPRLTFSASLTDNFQLSDGRIIALLTVGGIQEKKEEGGFGEDRKLQRQHTKATQDCNFGPSFSLAFKENSSDSESKSMSE